VALDLSSTIIKLHEPLSDTEAMLMNKLMGLFAAFVEKDHELGGADAPPEAESEDGFSPGAMGTADSSESIDQALPHIRSI
jgi:hypothetical protein